MTLAEACELPRMPDRLEVYDWLRDPSVKLDDRPFVELYKLACQDRMLTWQDEAARTYDTLELTGDGKVDQQLLRMATDKANLLLRISKDQQNTVKISAGTEQINVNIKTFEVPEC